MMIYMYTISTYKMEHAFDKFKNELVQQLGKSIDDISIRDKVQNTRHKNEK